MNENRRSITHCKLEIDLLTRKAKALESEIQTLRTQNKTYKELIDAIMNEKSKFKDMK